jgi:hypothetical protein
MKAERLAAGGDKKASYLLLTDDAGNAYRLELALRGSGHAITKDKRRLRSQLLDKLADAINVGPA